MNESFYWRKAASFEVLRIFYFPYTMGCIEQLRIKYSQRNAVAVSDVLSAAKEEVYALYRL